MTLSTREMLIIEVCRANNYRNDMQERLRFASKDSKQALEDFHHAQAVYAEAVRALTEHDQGGTP